MSPSNLSLDGHLLNALTWHGSFFARMCVVCAGSEKCLELSKGVGPLSLIPSDGRTADVAGFG